MTIIGQLISRGYQPGSAPVHRIDYAVASSSGELELLSSSEVEPRFAQALRGGVAVVLPTYVDRASRQAHESMIDELLPQIDALRRSQPALAVVLIVGLQYRHGQSDEARARMAAMVRRVHAHPGVAFAGILLEASGKVVTQNAAIRLADACGLASLIWLDDDIGMSEGCMAQLAKRFVECGGRAAVGATKLAASGDHWSSRLLFAIKRHTRPPTDYPNACCMMLPLDVVRSQIPERYLDDGYVFFELLDPTANDPFERLQLVPDAICSHTVGGSSARTTVGHTRRMLVSHQIMMADYPDKARFYRRHVLFYGLYPLAAWDGRLHPGAAVRWLVKAVYFGCFWRVGGELLLRGLTRRPLRAIDWSAHPRAVPDGALPTAPQAAPGLVGESDSYASPVRVAAS